MALKNLPRWANVGITGQNGAGYFGIGQRAIAQEANRAERIKNQEQVDKEKADRQAMIDATSKLVESARANGGKVSKEDYAKVGKYDPKLLDSILNNIHSQGVADQRLGISRASLAATKAHYLAQESNSRKSKEDARAERLAKMILKGQNPKGRRTSSGGSRKTNSSTMSITKAAIQALKDKGAYDYMDEGNKASVLEQALNNANSPQVAYDGVFNGAVVNPIRDWAGPLDGAYTIDEFKTPEYWAKLRANYGNY